MYFTALILCSIFLISACLPNIATNEVNHCDLEESLVNTIESYRDVIINITRAISEDAKHEVWNELAAFVDKFGNRISGSQNLEKAIDYMLERSAYFKLDNIQTQPVEVPHWIRGFESATLLSPRHAKMDILGLGGSVSTPKNGITADVMVVETFEELEKNAAKVKGKIVVFAEKWESYGKTVKYRDYAAAKTAALGGVASLVRSITPFSINSPHTGWQDYQKDVQKIPTAAITVEDAEMLLRMYKNGEKITINITMEAQTLKPVKSRNTIVEIAGYENPKDYVLVSGHLDSWDVGTGAMDDGGGAFISWYTTVLLKRFEMRPRRSIRAVLWTGEEEGLFGAFAYKKANSQDNMVLLMESDEGTFNPQGIIFKGSKRAQCIMSQIMETLVFLNTTDLDLSNNVGSDIMAWADSPIPLASLKNQNEKYFWYHHSDGDRMSVEDPAILDKCLALWMSVAYIVADLPTRLPHE